MMDEENPYGIRGRIYEDYPEAKRRRVDDAVKTETERRLAAIRRAECQLEDEIREARERQEIREMREMRERRSAALAAAEVAKKGNVESSDNGLAAGRDLQNITINVTGDNNVVNIGLSSEAARGIVEAMTSNGKDHNICRPQLDTRRNA